MAREARTEQRAWDRCRRADGEQRPVDATVQVPDNSGGAQAEPDRDVRADRAERVRADEAKQRADTKRAEDQADEPS